MELLQDSDSSLATIGPHWPSSYPEYLSPYQGKDEQQRIVWARLLSQRSNLAKSLKEQKERYQALLRELNPRTTQVESSHDPLYRDIELEEYNIKLQHIPGKNNGRADTLSRRPDYDQGTTNNQNVTVLPYKLFIRALTSQDLEQDKEILKPWVDPHKLNQISGTWWKGDQLVITADVPLRRTIVQMHHDPPAYGHPGISRTLELTARRYWWPRMAQDIKDYVKGCADCQRNKCYETTCGLLLYGYDSR